MKSDRSLALRLLELANSEHQLLKFTHEISEKAANFLDITVFKGDRFITEAILHVKCYSNPTETYQYLHRSLTHHPSCCKSFIPGKITRFCRNCNNKIAHSKSRIPISGFSDSEINSSVDKAILNHQKKRLTRSFINKETAVHHHISQTP